MLRSFFFGTSISLIPLNFSDSSVRNFLSRDPDPFVVHGSSFSRSVVFLPIWFANGRVLLGFDCL